MRFRAIFIAAAFLALPGAPASAVLQKDCVLRTIGGAIDTHGFTEPLLASGSTSEKLLRSFRRARGFLDETPPAALLESVFRGASDSTLRLLRGSARELDHVGFIAPAGTDLATLAKISSATGFADGQRSFASTIVAKELGARLGTEPVPTQIFIGQRNSPTGAASGIEVFVPSSTRADIDEWIREGVGTHVAFRVKDLASIAELKKSLEADGFAMPAFMNGNAMFNPQQRSTTLYFDLTEDGRKLRVEFVHHAPPESAP